MKILWIPLTGRKEVKKIWLKSDVNMEHKNVVNRDNLTASMKTIQMKYNLRRLLAIVVYSGAFRIKTSPTSVWLILYPLKIIKTAIAWSLCQCGAYTLPEQSWALVSLPVGPSELWELPVIIRPTNTTWRSIILFLTERIWSQAKLTQQCLMTLYIHLLWRLFSKRKEFNRIYHCWHSSNINTQRGPWFLICLTFNLHT